MDGISMGSSGGRESSGMPGSGEGMLDNSQIISAKVQIELD